MSAAVQSSSRITTGRPYLNHIMGFSNVWQPENAAAGTSYAKYVSGVQGVSIGYIFRKGHAAELGLEISGLSNTFVGYRYYYRDPRISIWPFAGGGAGLELAGLSLKDGPPESDNYFGSRMMVYGTLGVVIPLVDVGLKAEIRFNFYGGDRLVLTQGLGATIFF